MRLLRRLVCRGKNGGVEGLERCSLHRELGIFRDSAPMNLFTVVYDADEEAEITSNFMNDLRSVESMNHDELESLAGSCVLDHESCCCCHEPGQGQLCRLDS